MVFVLIDKPTWIIFWSAGFFVSIHSQTCPLSILSQWITKKRIEGETMKGRSKLSWSTSPAEPICFLFRRKWDAKRKQNIILFIPPLSFSCTTVFSFLYCHGIWLKPSCPMAAWGITWVWDNYQIVGLNVLFIWLAYLYFRILRPMPMISGTLLARYYRIIIYITFVRVLCGVEISVFFPLSLFCFYFGWSQVS